jgi:fructose/tagatose bisphosphate aldolase
MGAMGSPEVATTVAELLGRIDRCAAVEEGRLRIADEAAFRERGIADVVWSATFSEDPDVVAAARWIVWETSLALGSPSASIHELYLARGRGEVSGFTVPALNLRTQVFDMARVATLAARELDAGAVIFELARSEQEYTYQRPGEYITGVLGGAIAGGWSGPVFVQGDHYQFNAKKYAVDPDGVTEGLRKLAVEALGAGYGNIDIDSSTLVDLSQPTLDAQQRTNYTRCAELTALIRQHEPEGQTTSVGGEIGEVGKKNSTPEELRAFLDGYRRELDRLAGSTAIGLSKVSVQTGTSHGGVPLPGGGVAQVALDLEVLERMSAICREYGMAGAVQHGASTLPDELFHRFPAVGAAEIHLATGFQNLLYDHPAFPTQLTAEIESWCHVNAPDERKDGETETQFLYKTRKKALGPLKRRLWDLPEREAILADQQAKLRFLFDQLGVAGTRAMVARHVRPIARHLPAPEAVIAASTRPGARSSVG